MKKIILFSFLFLSSIGFSQAPEGINYQAVIRNGSGNLVASTNIAIQVKIRQTTATGTVVYQERHSVLTSAQGLINLVIGSGTPQVGTFNGINWGMGPYFVNLGIDLANGVNYQDYGTQQLMSVPYALYAKSSGNQLNQWRYGNTIPPSTLGNFGDFYLDVITGNVYYKNNNTTWVLTGNIKGPVGPSGLQGPAGAAGAQGIQGPAGATGAQGPIGLTGPQGVAGVNGTNGTNGVDGKNTLAKTTTEVAGANCITGGVKIEYGLDVNNNGTLDVSEINASSTKYVCNGAVGATGLQGPAGIAGAQGPQGPQGTPGSQNAWSLTGNAGTSPASNFIGTIDAQDWIIKTNNSERMRVTSIGGLGIGTSNPKTKFHLLGDGGPQSSTITLEGSNSHFHNGSINFISNHSTANKRASGLFFFNKVGQNEWFIGRPYANDAGNYPNDEIVFQRLTTPTHTDSTCALTDGLGGNTGTQRLMVIKNNGFVGISTNTPDQLLSVNGNASKQGGGSWAAFSDRRVKQDIKPFVDGLEVLMKLNPVTFKYNEKSGYTDLNKSFVGFIAQDVENVAPYMVNLYDDTKGPSGLSDKRQFDESALNKILVNAVKEQQVIIENQQTKINELQQEIDQIKEMINQLKKD